MSRAQKCIQLRPIDLTRPYAPIVEVTLIDEPRRTGKVTGSLGREHAQMNEYNYTITSGWCGV